MRVARLVARLRAADLPVRLIRWIAEAARAATDGNGDATVFLAVYVRRGPGEPDRRTALLDVTSGADAHQLPLL